MRFSDAQVVTMRRKLGVAVSADAATIVAALGEALDERADPPAPAVPVAPSPQSAMPEGQSDVVAWGLSTGRYSRARAAVWARAADDERRRTGSATQVERTIQSLHPVYAPPVARTTTTASAAWTMPDDEHEFPLTAEMDLVLFGPSDEQRRRADDLAAEAEFAAALEREREAATDDLTEDEQAALFGRDVEQG